uniref:AAA family ATPase, subfamily protein n=1 Tax=uncultured organism TaxID=155900 RepID=M1QAN0_9ZZZZ|nr:AAA family ATPase, subfamily protein [uncultured organism]
MTDKKVLKVKEAPQEDIGRNRARLGAKTRMELDVEVGDIVKISGDKETVAKVFRLSSDDEGDDVVRVDGLVRKNAKASIGDKVELTKVTVEEADQVTIAPVIEEGNRLKFGEGIDSYVKKRLLKRPVLAGDAIVVPGIALMGGSVPFMVISTTPVDSVVITKETEVVVKEEPVSEGEVMATTRVTYEDVGGLEDELKRVREMIELPLKHPKLFERLSIDPPKGVLLHGPPGTGKTWIAKAVANEAGANFFSVQGPEIMSKYYGQSEEKLREKFEEAKDQSPSIIFIDELDSIAPKRDDVKGEVERRVVAQLLTLLDGLTQRGETIVIAATNRVDAIDPALRRPGRFDREIEIGLPDIEGRKEIMQIHTRGMPVEKDVELPRLAELTHGFAGADLESLVKEAAMRALRRYLPEIEMGDPIPSEVLEKMEVKEKDFLEALREIEPSSLREIMVEVPQVSWDDVGGLENIKDKLKDSVQRPISEPESFIEKGIEPPKGILLYGPPGTGKTLLAKAIANESNANFISIKGPEVLSKWVGESEKAVREIFKKARQTAPSVVFLDELDALAPERTAGGTDGTTERVVNQLLTSLDGIERTTDIVVLGATNRPDKIDSALLRAGRFDHKLSVPVPDDKARKKIFEVHTRYMPLANSVDMDFLVENTRSYVGADIEALCRDAGLKAIKDGSEMVTMQHFNNALEEVEPSVDEDVIEMYEKWGDDMEKSVKKKKDFNGVDIYR